ncbi:hypothetical protein [Mycoplana azooxidifex]|nr:hypothetical protein [Mycoplana azooxidifex]
MGIPDRQIVLGLIFLADGQALRRIEPQAFDHHYRELVDRALCGQHG